MAQEVEIWFDSAPAPAAIALAVEPFGQLHEMRDGILRLVEGDEPPGQGVPLVLVEVAKPPEAVRRHVPRARAALRASAVLTGSRGFWLAQLAAQLQRRLGGVVYLPDTNEAFPDVLDYEDSWPGHHEH